MLYGTRKELNKKLKRMFGNDERFALLVWTKQDVMAQAENMTETEADALLELIGCSGIGEHVEDGVSFRTVQALYAGIRPNIPRLNIPVDTLFRITDIAAQALSGEDAKVWSLTADHYPSIAGAQAEIAWLKRDAPPERLADAMTIHLPFAEEWLTAAECDDLLAFLRGSIDTICSIARQDAHRLAAALKPSATPRLMERWFGDWRLLADEYADDWTPVTDTDRLDAVLDAVLVRSARYCPVLLTLVNEREEDIEAEGFLAHTLIIPGDPVRRWFDRATLKNMIIGVRNGRVQDD